MESQKFCLKEDRIFLHLRNGEWNDCTRQTSEVYFCSNYVGVRFHNGKSYRFSFARVRILKQALLDTSIDARLLSASFDLVDPAIYISDRRSYLFDKKHGPRPISKDELTNICSACETNGRLFGYYLNLAKQFDSESEEETDILSKQYEDLAKRPLSSSCVFHSFLHKKAICRTCPPLIYPFPHNKSQMKAIERAFSYNISVIQGPPGTGKTQTILNIIANILCQGKTVAVISNNNLAVENVLEKLESEGYGFLCAFLGNSENRDRFFSKSHPIPHLSVKESIQSLKFIEQLEKSELEAFESQSLLANLEQERDALRKEWEMDFASSQTQSLKFGQGIPSKSLLALSATLEAKGKENFGFLQRIRLKLRYGVPLRQTKCSIPHFSEQINRTYGERKLAELDRDILTQKTICERFQKTKVYETEMELSRNFLDASINRWLDGAPICPFEKETFKARFSSFIRRYPVILSSTLSLSSSVPKDFCFDYLIMDEASQSTMVSAFPSLTKGKNIVIIGDDCQLPPVITKESADFEFQAAKKFDISEEWRSNGRSFLSFAQRLPQVPITLLKVHYRSAKQIIGFSNQRIYGEQLEFQKPEDGRNHLSIRKTVPGNHARKNDTGGSGQYNQREIDEIIDLVQSLPKDVSVGVITPYRRQAELLRELLPQSVEIGTVHAFQGKEEQVIVLSTVANDANDYLKDGETIRSFVNDEHLINVAVTRAKDQFVLVTSDKNASSNRGILADLVKYIRYQTNQGIEEGRIRSVFDILYSEYAEARAKIIKSGNVLSENLVETCLKTILKEEKYASLSYSMHVSLKSILTIPVSIYSEEESRYLTHPWTHLDFVVFNRYDKKPVLAIEVNGISYHEQSDRQAVHDEIKQKCLQDCGLPLLILKTNGSNEKSRIESCLDEILK